MIGWFLLSNAKEHLQKMLVRKCSYRGKHNVLISFLTFSLSMYWQNAFVRDPLENWFGRQRSLGSRKDNPSIASMTGFGYSDSPIRKQTNFKPVVNGNFADSSMIALTNKPLPCWKPKKEWKFKRKYWIKKLSN